MERTGQGQFLFQGLLIELVVQDGLDALVGAGPKMEGASAGGFQSHILDGFAEPDDSQAGTEALFGVGPILEDFLDDEGADRPDGGGPVHHAAGGPLQVSLVRLGSMFIQGREAAWLVTAPMSGHAFALVEELDGRVREPHVHRLMNQGIGDAVVVVVNLNMVVDVHLGLLPLGEDEGFSRQRFQPQPF